MSSFSCVTFETLVPGASRSSWRVTRGPVTRPTIFASMPKWPSDSTSGLAICVLVGRCPGPGPCRTCAAASGRAAGSGGPRTRSRRSGARPAASAARGRARGLRAAASGARFWISRSTCASGSSSASSASSSAATSRPAPSGSARDRAAGPRCAARPRAPRTRARRPRASARACSSSLRKRVPARARRPRARPPIRSPIRRPVRSSAPPAIRKTKTRCAPGVGEQRRGRPVERLAHHAAAVHHRVECPTGRAVSPPPGPEPERAGREAERQAERERDRAGPQARGRLDPLAGRERDARADHEQRQQIGDSADQEPEARRPRTRRPRRCRSTAGSRAAGRMRRGPARSCRRVVWSSSDSRTRGSVQARAAAAQRATLRRGRDLARRRGPAPGGAPLWAACGSLAMAARPRVRPAAIQFDAAGTRPCPDGD